MTVILPPAGGDRSARGCIADWAAKGCRMRVENVCGPVIAGGPADIAKQTRNFQAQKLGIRRNLSLPYVFFVFVHSFLPCADLKKGHVGAAGTKPF